MDDWPYRRYVPDPQRVLLNRDRLSTEARRARAQQAEAARVAELEQTQSFDAVGSPVEADVSLPVATPPGVALTF